MSSDKHRAITLRETSSWIFVVGLGLSVVCGIAAVVTFVAGALHWAVDGSWTFLYVVFSGDGTVIDNASETDSLLMQVAGVTLVTGLGVAVLSILLAAAVEARAVRLDPKVYKY